MSKALICITTCNRLSEVKKYILPYISFVNSNDEFDFVLSLDGQQEDYVSFCNQFKIPLIYSEEREGVGISKNRVLKKFPDYQHYFFIDDDVELLNSKIFTSHVTLGSQSDEFNHMSSTNLFVVSDKAEIHGIPLIYGMIGGGYFNYFNKKGIDKVGGWHTLFAKYKRYGHTEHSYRFLNIGDSKFPFTIISNCINDLIIHNPSHVTEAVENASSNETELFVEEQQLIDQKLTFFPITTLSEYRFNGFELNYNSKVAEFLTENRRKYPLIKGQERLKCFSSYYFFLSKIKQSRFSKIWYFCLAFVCHPFNPEIKHVIKTKLIRK